MLIKGDIKLGQYIISKTENKNPQGNVPLFHMAREKFEIARKHFFHHNHWNKITPLHLAALLGNAKLCKLILDNIDDGNSRGVFFCDQ